MGKEQELVEAARNGNYYQVQKLLSLRTRKVGPLASLRRGPGPNAQDATGYSALHHAALNGHKEVVKLLLDHEASANIVDSKGSTPLHLAAWTGKAEIVDVLLSHGPSIPDVNFMNHSNETALHCAAQYGHTAVVTLLLEFSGDPAIKNMKDETPLDLAAQYGRLETVDLLIRSHPELLLPYSKENCKNRAFGITPLHAASRNGHKNVVNLLLKNGFYVNAVTPVGTALHEATLCGKVDVAKILLKEGVDLNLTDCQNRTVMDIADELNTSVTREIRSLIRDMTDLVNIDDEWNRSSRVAPPTLGSPYDNLFLPSKQPQTAKPWDSVIQDFKKHRRHKSFEAGLLSKSLDMMESDDSTSSSSNRDPSPRDIAKEQQQQVAAATAAANGGGNRPAGARSRVAGGRLRSRTVGVEIVGPRAPLGPISVQQTAARFAAGGGGGGSDSGRVSSGDSGDKWSVTPDGYLTIGGKARAPKKPPRRAVPPGGGMGGPGGTNTIGRHSRTLSFDTGADSQYRSSLTAEFPAAATTTTEGSRGPEPGSDVVVMRREARSAGQLVRRRGIAGSFDNVLDDDSGGGQGFGGSTEMVSGGGRRVGGRSGAKDEFPDSKVTRKSGSADNLLDSSTDAVAHQQQQKKKKKRKKFVAEARISLDSTLDPRGGRSGAGVVPLSPTHYAQPPTPDHPPPTPCQALSSISARIRPVSDIVCLKRQSRDIETETDEVLLVRRVDAASATTLTSTTSAGATTTAGSSFSDLGLQLASGSTSSLNTDPGNGVEEYVGEGLFSGLFKGSVRVPGSRSRARGEASEENPLRADPGSSSYPDRPRSLSKMQSSSFGGADARMADKRAQLNASSDAVAGVGSATSLSTSSLSSAASSSVSSVNSATTTTAAKDVEGSVSRSAPGFGHERSLSLQLLSPFDEKEEWNKISEIIASISSGLLDKEDALIPPFVDKEICGRQATLMSNSGELKNWLTKLGHPELLAPFLSRGFDDIQFLGSGILEDADLAEMGVRDPRTRRRIIEDAARLPCKLPRSGVVVDRFDSVPEWLAFLNLEFYAPKFLRYRFGDMERVRKMWEAELTTILEITLPGHKKRILASVGTAERDGGQSSLSSSTSSLAAAQQQQQKPSGRPGDVSADLSRLSNEITEYQTELREKLGYSSASPSASKTSTLNRVRARKKTRAPPPPPVAAAAALAAGGANSGTTPAITTTDVDDGGGVSGGFLALREPREVAVMELTAAAPAHWCHPVTALIDGTCDYPAQYVGSAVVRRPDGTESTRLSISKLKKAAEVRKRAKVKLCVSYLGVRFVDNRSRRILCEHDVHNINSACQDDQDLRYFAYTTFDEPSGEHFCHVFFSETPETSSEVILTLGQAFEAAYHLTMRKASSSSNSNPNPNLLPACNGGHSSSGPSPTSAGPPRRNNEPQQQQQQHHLLTATEPPPEMSRSATAESSSSSNRWPTERSRSASDVQLTSSSSFGRQEKEKEKGEGEREEDPNKRNNGYVAARQDDSASSSSDGSPPTVCKLEKASGKQKKSQHRPDGHPQQTPAPEKPQPPPKMKSAKRLEDLPPPPRLEDPRPDPDPCPDVNKNPIVSRKNSDSSATTSGPAKPKIAEKPKNVPPKPAHLLRAGSPHLQPSPLVLRKCSSTPRVDVASANSSGSSSPVLKRAPLATSEDF